MSKSDQPALAPPAGVPAEFYNPYTLRPYQALTIVASVLVTTTMVAARLYTKKVIVNAMKWEDCKLCYLGCSTIKMIVNYILTVQLARHMLFWMGELSLFWHFNKLLILKPFTSIPKSPKLFSLIVVCVGHIHGISRHRILYRYSRRWHSHVESL